jgi:hypothetical protein
MSLRLLFTDTSYLIDNYQREYAWSQDDVQILIDDLWEGFEGHNGRPAEMFFLGPFVYVQHDQFSRWLVDGQQRFTTLHLILLHLHQIAQQCGEPDTAAKLYNLVYGYTRHNRPRRFRIDINERRPALEALRDGKKFTITGKTLSVRNLWQRGEQLRGLLEERIDSDNCARFADWMPDQVVMVAITAPDRPSRYRIFESMNDRGARLTPVDLLKSHLMSKVGDAEDEATELNNKWRTMLADLTAAGDDNPDTPRIFLKAALLSHWAQEDQLRFQITVEEPGLQGAANRAAREAIVEAKYVGFFDYAGIEAILGSDLKTKNYAPGKLVAVGTAIAGGPPRRSQRAGLPHWAPVMGTWRRTAFRAKGA